MNIEIGKNIRQPDGFDAFVLNPFPPKGVFDMPPKMLVKIAEADRLVGKLDGITHTLPDVEFFLNMFVTKDATSSSQIEGTQASMVDAIEKDAGVGSHQNDADDILFYIKALNYGIKRLKDFPLSLRLIRETHEKLMVGARSTHFADPGQFRASQNWISGVSPAKASFVPPPVVEMKKSLDDFERFLHDEKEVLPLVHIALVHGQFETIHPFLDGNGRVGRLLITMLLCHRNLLERPVLFLSSYFKKNQKVYYNRINGYHHGEILPWVDFFLDGVIDTANESIAISKQIRELRDKDTMKIQALGKRESESGILVLSRLFGNPIVTTTTIMEWTGFTRVGAQKLIDRFIKLGILSIRDKKALYDKSYVYSAYLNIFLR
jgi:Fic family protein